MPTYDYVCDSCDHKFELFQGIKEPVKKKCPECGKPKLRRLFGIGAAIMFKGSGFYQTDYRSESYKKSAAADSSASTADAKPAENKPAETKATSSGSNSAQQGSKKSKSDKWRSMSSMVCPTCHRPFDPEGSAALPFCSPRCRQVDLGRWLKESYAVPVPRHDEDGAESGELADESP